MHSTALACMRKIAAFPLSRIVIALVPIAAAAVFAGPGVEAFVRVRFAAGATAAALAAAAVTMLLADLWYRLLVRWIEKRSAVEIGLRGAGGELCAGAVLGACLFAVTVGFLALAGCYHVAGAGGWIALAAALPAAAASGYVEELAMRGVLFRVAEEWLGSWPALAASAALFGMAHLGNPHATWSSTLAIMLEAGVLLAAAFMLTRRLWFAVGIHFAWNFVQGAVFGLPVSGHAVRGLLQGELSGPAALCGGEFGAEASPIAVAVCLAAAFSLLRRAHRKGHVVPALPRRRGLPGRQDPSAPPEPDSQDFPPHRGEKRGKNEA